MDTRCLKSPFISRLLMDVHLLHGQLPHHDRALDARIRYLFRDIHSDMLGLTLVAGGATYASSLDDEYYAVRLLKALGFKHPWRVNLAPFSQARLGSGLSRHVYNLRSALEAELNASAEARQIVDA